MCSWMYIYHFIKHSNSTHMEDIWNVIDSLRAAQQPKPVYEEYDQYMCACGGVKSYEFELPTCTSCGRVDEYYISDEPEWVGGPDDNTDPSRVGVPTNTMLYSDSWGMGTMIVGRTCQKMAKINLHSSMNHRDRALHHAYVQFDHVCKGKLKLNDMIIDDIKIMYKQFNEERLTRGAIRSGVKANCILYACKKNGVSRTLQEIADAVGIPVKDISRTNDIFRETTGEDTGTTMSSDIISRLFNSMSFIAENDRGKVKMRVVKACEDAQRNPKLMGKTPKGIASAVIFNIVTGMGYDIQRIQIAEICEVSVPTLMKIEKVLKEL